MRGQTAPKSTPNNKRYLILTYAAEFDRVHYPLPLIFEEHPDTAALQATIRRLRAELDARGAKGKGAGHGASGADPGELRRLREDNTQLRVSEIPSNQSTGTHPVIRNRSMQNVC